MADLKSAVDYILRSEGGLSRATTDTASSFPSPYVYQGVTGWHTNKGVTYKTFKTLAPQLGYADTADNFLTMPIDIWMKIYSQGYWNPMGANGIKSQAMADAIADFAWASGVGGATTQLKKFLAKNGITTTTTSQIVDGINSLTDKDEKGTFSNFIQFRKDYFTNLAANPVYAPNLKGWLNRMGALQTHGLALLGEALASIKDTSVEGAILAKKHWLGTALIIIGIIGVSTSLILKN